MVDDALAALDSALRVAPGYEPALSFKGSVLLQFRRVEEAEGTFEDFLRAHPENATAWKNYGFVLKTVGKFGEAVAAYRTSVAMEPKESGAWWGIANLKLARFFQHDIGEMERILEGSLDEVMQIEVHFALAKAHEVMGNYERAALHLQEGNRLRLDANPHDIDEVQRNVGKAIETYTRSFFTRREGQGCKSHEPIFVIGMPRSGSTLIEQILSSHSLIEGTQELFAIHKLEGELVGESTPTIEDAVAKADPAKLRALGERYLFLTRHVRLTDRPHYIDKNPANWRHTGFIHTILPNAKIIDVRRNPMDCCFANYGQHFNWGANFTYGQAEIARQYGEYVRLMRHFEHEIPGIVHKVIYDDLVDDFEPAVRLLFDYLELPFEEACLRFFYTKRAVHTPSSEQVRQPINKAGFGRWRNYEPWLGELKGNLGEVLENWR
jgi:tetratricopeptide (TPR) repeat protein